MKTTISLLFTITFCFLFSCKKEEKEIVVRQIDYANQRVLDSLIKATPYSTDTLFLGFRIGMSKSEYKAHIENIRESGRNITYSESNRFSTAAGIFELGGGYTFNTDISIENSGKPITGNGKYFLEPNYNSDGKLDRLNILSIEEWKGDYGFEKPDWLKNNIENSSQEFENKDLKKALIDADIVEEYNFLRQKNNLVIYETALTMNYVDLKAILIELRSNIIKADSIKKKTKDIKF